MFMSVLRKGLVGAASLAGGVAVLSCATGTSASAHASNLDTRISRIEDEAAIKRLVDTFSNLADRKDIDTQVMLFTDDATVQSWVDGKPAPALKGRNELAKAFSSFLAQFTTVYHINGQQTVTINGDEATGIAYCLVVLISKAEGQAAKTSGHGPKTKVIIFGGQPFWQTEKQIGEHLGGVSTRPSTSFGGGELSRPISHGA